MNSVRSALALGAALLPITAHAQNLPNSGAVLGRDAGSTIPPKMRDSVVTPRNDSAASAPVISVPDGVMVRQIQIDGASQINQDSFAAATSAFTGKKLNVEGLQQLARSVADQARARGYIFASAMVPQQEVVNGVVMVRLDEGRIDEVRINGVDNERLRAILDPLTGPAALREEVERQLLLAEDLPGIDIESTTYVREAGRGILVVNAKDARASGTATIDNYGSKGVGPLRMRLDLNLAGLVMDGDELTVHAIGTPVSSRELAYVQAGYSIPVGDGRLGFTAAAGRTQPGDIPGKVLVGRSRSLALNASYPVLRSNNASLWVNADIAYLNVDAHVLGLLLQRDDIVTLSFSANGSLGLAGGRLNGGIGFVQGLGILGAAAANDPFASRTDASGMFSKFTGWLSWTGPIGGDFSVKLAANGQIATRPLLSAQEIGLGGPGFGRAYDYSERTGDGGVMGQIELRRDFAGPVRHIDWVQLYGFADGGYVYNLKNGLGGGTLMSAGAGLRAGAGKFEMSAEAAMPVVHSRAEGGKNPRINLSLGYSF